MAWVIEASAMASCAALGRVRKADADVHGALLQNRIDLEWFQKIWVPKESAGACASMRTCRPARRLYPARHADRPNLHLRRGSTASVITEGAAPVHYASRGGAGGGAGVGGGQPVRGADGSTRRRGRSRAGAVGPGRG